MGSSVTFSNSTVTKNRAMKSNSVLFTSLASFVYIIESP